MLRRPVSLRLRFAQVEIALSVTSMLRVPCDSDRYSFASLVEVLQNQGVAQCLGVLRQAGLKSAWDLENCSRSKLRELMGDVALDSLLATRKRVNAPTRRNVPVVHPYARGSMQRLGLGGPTHSLTIDVEQGDKDFLEDR